MPGRGVDITTPSEKLTRPRHIRLVRFEQRDRHFRRTGGRDEASGLEAPGFCHFDREGLRQGRHQRRCSVRRSARDIHSHAKGKLAQADRQPGRRAERDEHFLQLLMRRGNVVAGKSQESGEGIGRRGSIRPQALDQRLRFAIPSFGISAGDHRQFSQTGSVLVGRLPSCDLAREIARTMAGNNVPRTFRTP